MTPFFNELYDNDPTTNPTEGTQWTYSPWGVVYPNIPSDAKWIWHDAGETPDGAAPGPLPGSDQNEFLIFRVVGQASPLVVR